MMSAAAATISFGVLAIATPTCTAAVTHVDWQCQQSRVRVADSKCPLGCWQKPCKLAQQQSHMCVQAVVSAAEAEGVCQGLRSALLNGTVMLVTRLLTL
jgi:uncharacterized membrane protein YebE (DUF533 family)